MIIARLCPVDPESVIDASSYVYLAAAPFPGDIVDTKAGQRVRVIRRTFIDHGPPNLVRAADYVDLMLNVRMVGEKDG